MGELTDQARWCAKSAVVKFVDGSWVQSVLRSTTGAVVKFVDGSWVQSVLRSMTGIGSATGAAESEWRAARVSWQVLSEELGDGDLERAHVAAYERLMDALASQTTPRGHELAFLDWLADAQGRQPNPQQFVAAVLQLAVCSDPSALPEVLGFNLSYEGMPYHLLVTARELRELKIDSYCPSQLRDHADFQTSTCTLP